MIAARDQRTAITGSQVKARVHLLRAQCDAIVVGMGTVIVDDPELTCRLPGLEQRSPKPFVMSRDGHLPPQSKLARREAEVLRGNVTDSLANLASRGINRLLVEGGAVTARSFLQAGVVDEVQVFQSPLVIGAQGVKGLADGALQPFAVREEERLGSDVLTVYEARF